MNLVVCRELPSNVVLWLSFVSELVLFYNANDSN